MEINRQKTIDVSAEALWRIVGIEFNEISKWAPYVETSYANPNLPKGQQGRVCQVTGFGEALETLTELDDKNRKLAFAFTSKKNPFFIQNVDYTWQIKPHGDKQAQLFVDVNLKLMPVFKQILGRMVGNMITERTDMLIDQLKYFAETGNVKPIEA